MKKPFSSYRRLSLRLIAALAVLLSAAAAVKVDPQKLTLEELFRVKPFGGQPPRAMAFSLDDRFLAYLWNPINAIGKDLYLYDLKTGQTRRVSSLDVMKEFDPPADVKKFQEKADQKRREETRKQQLYDAQRDYLAGKQIDLSFFEKEDIEALKKEFEKKKMEEAEKNETDKKIDQKKETEKEEWEWRDELLKKKEKEAIKPGDLYPGVTDFIWSKKANELIFGYRGDLFRYFPDKNRIERLTMTDKHETIISYTADGLGYIYQDEKRVMKAVFNSSYLFQLNHELPADDKFKIESTAVSPDGKWLAVMSSKTPEGAKEREVQIVNYRKRFAEMKSFPRELADDVRNQPEYKLTISQVRDRNYGEVPQPAFAIPGGDLWYETSRLVWSEDSSRYLFVTWEQEKNSLKIWVGKASETEKPEVVLESNWDVSHDLFPLVGAKFTPDGKKVVACLDEFGFIQPQLIDIAIKSRTLLLKGDFESLPVLGFSKDGKSLYIASGKDDPAFNSIYKIDLAGGEPIKVGKSDGKHRLAAVSNSGRWIAANFGNWSQRAEMYLIDTTRKSDKALTLSHDPAWEDYNILKPELFKFNNRHGDQLSAFIFKPAGWKAEDKRPGLVYVYGGAGIQVVEGDSFQGAAYLFPMDMAAKHGFVAVSVDPHGSGGYGTKFNDANFERVGRPQVEELEDLVKYMGANLGVDVGRLGLHGWSFGGFQTQMMMYSSPDTFACGIAGAGPTEWENYNSWYVSNFIGPSVRNKPTIRKYSLLPLAKNLRHPLLLVHGMEDSNVLYQDTVLVYKALLEAGKETLVELFLDPEGNHGLGGIVFEKARFKKFEEFFLRHLTKTAVTPGL